MGYKILVIDDEKSIREYLFCALTCNGKFDVVVAENGQEALQKIAEQKVDLALVDLKMPGMDGLQLIKEISKFAPETVSVMMTGYGTIDSAIEAMKIGATDYLLKPFDVDELVSRLEKILKERNSYIKPRVLANQLEKAHHELRRLEETKSEFLLLASHELRTPLTVLKSSIQLILDRKMGKITENQKEFLTNSKQNIDRLTSVVNDFLELSRIKLGDIEMRFEELDLKSLIRYVFSLQEAETDDKSIKLRNVIPRKLPRIYGDRQKVEKIFIYLLRNAIRSMPEGGEVCISVRALIEENRVLISVTYSGVQLPEDEFGKFFRKFYKEDGPLHLFTHLNSLDLAIAKGLIETHDGRIREEGEARGVNTFEFTLPIKISMQETQVSA